MKNLLIIITLFLCSCTRISPHTQAGLSVMHSHIKEMNEQNGWLGEAIGGSFYDNIVLLSVRLIALDNQFTIDQTRREMIKGISTFLSQINNDPKLAPHLNHYPFTPKDVEYGIAIYNNEGKWLGYVSLIKGNLNYSIVNSEKKLEHLLREPYTEALEKIQNSSQNL